jgi:hypothetical protein
MDSPFLQKRKVRHSEFENIARVSDLEFSTEHSSHLSYSYPINGCFDFENKYKHLKSKCL